MGVTLTPILAHQMSDCLFEVESCQQEKSKGRKLVFISFFQSQNKIS